MIDNVYRAWILTIEAENRTPGNIRRQVVEEALDNGNLLHSKWDKNYWFVFDTEYDMAVDVAYEPDKKQVVLFYSTPERDKRLESLFANAAYNLYGADYEEEFIEKRIGHIVEKGENQ